MLLLLLLILIVPLPLEPIDYLFLLCCVFYVLPSHCYMVYCVSTINRHTTYAQCTHAQRSHIFHSVPPFSPFSLWVVQYLHNLTAGIESWAKASCFIRKKVLCQTSLLAYLCQDDGQQHLRVDTFIFSSFIKILRKRPGFPIGIIFVFMLFFSSLILYACDMPTIFWKFAHHVHHSVALIPSKMMMIIMTWGRNEYFSLLKGASYTSNLFR